MIRYSFYLLTTNSNVGKGFKNNQEGFVGTNSAYNDLLALEYYECNHIWFYSHDYTPFIKVNHEYIEYF